MGLHECRECTEGCMQPCKSWRCVNVRFGDPKVLFIIWDGVRWSVCTCVLFVVLYCYFTCRENVIK